MLNASCQIQEPLFVLVTHLITSSFSIPIYGIAFMVLLMKCPKYFNEYRNYLVVHIISGVLLEIHISAIWKLSVALPWATACSSGFFAKFAVNCFQIIIFLLIFTGVSALSLFVYRMKAATKHVENPTFQKLVFYLKNLFYLSSCFTLIFTFLIYSDLKNQREYKIKMEEKLGKLPEYMWCDNCYFMRFDSWIFLSLYTLSYCTVVFAFSSGVFAAIETFRCLNSNNLRISAKTAAIQKNCLFSLIITIIVHITLIFIPLAVYFLANVIVIDVPYLGTIIVIMVQDHGSISTFTMFITNNLLRKATKNLFFIPENLLCRSELKVLQKQKTSGVHVLAMN